MGGPRGIRKLTALAYLRGCAVGGIPSAWGTWRARFKRDAFAKSPGREVPFGRKRRRGRSVPTEIRERINGFADACLARMSETMDDPLLLTTDSDFRIYRASLQALHTAG